MQSIFANEIQKKLFDEQFLMIRYETSSLL